MRRPDALHQELTGLGDVAYLLGTVVTRRYLKFIRAVQILANHGTSLARQLAESGQSPCRSIPLSLHGRRAQPPDRCKQSDCSTIKASAGKGSVCYPAPRQKTSLSVEHG